MEGARYSSTPELGIFHAVIGVHGDILIPEDRLRAAVQVLPPLLAIVLILT